MIEEFRIKEKQRHEEYIERFGKFDPNLIEKQNEDLKKLKKDKPYFKKLETKYEQRQKQESKQILMHIHELYRPIDFESLRDRERKIKSQIRKQIEDREEQNKKSQIEEKPEDSVRPISNPYKDQINMLKEKMRKRKDFSKQVDEINLKDKLSSDGEEGGKDHASDEEKPPANNFLLKKVKSDEVMQRVKELQELNKDSGNEFMRSVSYYVANYPC